MPVDPIDDAVGKVVALHDAFQKEVGQLGPVERHGHDGLDSFINVARVVREHLPQKGRILDFGSGRCLKASVLSRLGYEVIAFDDFGDAWHRADAGRPERVIRFAGQCGVQVVSQIEGLRPFDMVMLHDVLEHLPNSPRPILERLIDLLEPHGLLFVTVPNAANLRKRLAILRGRSNLAAFSEYYWHEGESWRGHVREYVRDDLEQLAGFLKLEILQLRSCHHMLYKMPSSARPLFRYLTMIFPGWRDTWMLVGAKKGLSDLKGINQDLQ